MKNEPVDRRLDNPGSRGYKKRFSDETRLTGELDSLLKEMGERIVKGIYISVMSDENYDTDPLEAWLKAKILAWHETKLRKELYENNLRLYKLVRIIKRYNIVNYIKNYNEVIKLDWHDLRVPIVRNADIYRVDELNDSLNKSRGSKK